MSDEAQQCQIWLCPVLVTPILVPVVLIFPRGITLSFPENSAMHCPNEWHGHAWQAPSCAEITSTLRTMPDAHTLRGSTAQV